MPNSLVSTPVSYAEELVASNEYEDTKHNTSDVAHSKRLEEDEGTDKTGNIEPITYNDYQVWCTKLHDDTDVDLIKTMEENEVISVWNLSLNRTDFLVKLENRHKVDQELKKQGLEHEVLIPNVQRRIEETTSEAPTEWSQKALRHGNNHFLVDFKDSSGVVRAKRAKAKYLEVESRAQTESHIDLNAGYRMNWHTYPTMEIIDEYLDKVKDNYPSIVKIFTAGYSVENRTIKVALISNGNPNNIPILITGGMHAREWIGMTSAFYIMNNLVTKFDYLPNYMEDIDWYIMPLVNPDGYEYTRVRDRLWRKNRRRMSKCEGVDLNRNFEGMWNVDGVTDHKQCSDSYAGAGPFSEPETSAVRDVFDIIIKNKTPGAYVDFHTYGQLLLHPWSFTLQKSQQHGLLTATAKKMIQSIYDTTKVQYQYGSTPELLYMASGSSLDWAHSRGVKLSYAIEGRDTGTNGFLIPEEEIEVAGKEMLAAVSTLAKEINPSTPRTGLHEWL